MISGSLWVRAPLELKVCFFPETSEKQSENQVVTIGKTCFQLRPQVVSLDAWARRRKSSRTFVRFSNGPQNALSDQIYPSHIPDLLIRPLVLAIQSNQKSPSSCRPTFLDQPRRAVRARPPKFRRKSFSDIAIIPDPSKTSPATKNLIKNTPSACDISGE